MNRDADAPRHGAAAALAETKLRDDFGRDPALFQIRMLLLEFQRENERLVNRLASWMTANGMDRLLPPPELAFTG